LCTQCITDLRDSIFAFSDSVKFWTICPLS
jgi:hypothetical protein